MNIKKLRCIQADETQYFSGHSAVGTQNICRSKLQHRLVRACEFNLRSDLQVGSNGPSGKKKKNIVVESPEALEHEVI